MRWKQERPEIGDKRIKQVFLWLPEVLDGEWRWLEFAHIKQTYTDIGWDCEWRTTGWAVGVPKLVTPAKPDQDISEYYHE